jgi:Protein of unknwon function (DUF3310)
MDLVNHPPHYTEGRKYEAVDVLEHFFMRDALLWQVGKYLSRYGRKDDPLQDLQKAQWYLHRRLTARFRIVDLKPELAYSNIINAVVADWFGSDRDGDEDSPKECARMTLFYLLLSMSADTEEDAFGYLHRADTWLDVAIRKEQGDEVQ